MHAFLPLLRPALSSRPTSAGLSRPEQVVNTFFEKVGWHSCCSAKRDSWARRNRPLQTGSRPSPAILYPIELAEKGGAQREGNYVLPCLRRMTRRNAYGVYFIFKSMETGPSFRRYACPKYPTKDSKPPAFLAPRSGSASTHDYFYIANEVLGPWLTALVVVAKTFFPFQTTILTQTGHNFNFSRRELERSIRVRRSGFPQKTE